MRLEEMYHEAAESQEREPEPEPVYWCDACKHSSVIDGETLFCDLFHRIITNPIGCTHFNQ